MSRPVILDIDSSVTGLPDALRIDLAAWQEQLRFSCRAADLLRFGETLDALIPESHGTVLLGSGDFHHLTLPLLARTRPPQPMRVVVFDNHPDNMRFPFGVHCGSWVHRALRSPQVDRVDVVGICSADAGTGHAWENHIGSVRSGRVRYWCIDVDTRWSRWLGIDGIRSFPDADALADAFACDLAASDEPVYVSIDKDVLSPDEVTTNWDQGQMMLPHVLGLVLALDGRVVASDITGDVSTHRYASAFKRFLSAADGQTPPATNELAAWQQTHARANALLIGALARVSA